MKFKNFVSFCVFRYVRSSVWRLLTLSRPLTLCLCAIAIYSFTTFDVTLTFESTRGYKSVILKMSNSEDLPSSCACSVAPLEGVNVYKEQLSMPLEWMNLTAKEILRRRHPNFPLRMLGRANNGWCHLMPQPHAISWSSIYYQALTIAPNASFLFYSAFMDNRPLSRLRPTIRILTFTKEKHPKLFNLWCYVWFNTTGPPRISEVINYEYVDYQSKSDSRHMLFILTCPMAEANSTTSPTPLAVSVVSRPCDVATTLLQIYGSLERNLTTAFVKNASKDDEEGPLWSVAVCGPALFYFHEDFSLRLVEWLELLRAQGIARVFLSETQVHPNIEKVLKYYEDDGFVEVTRFMYPDPYVNEPNMRSLWALLERKRIFAMENMYFNDCVLRHMHEYRYIAHFDPDEMPVLPRHESFPLWVQDRVRNNVRDKPQFHLRWHTHFDDTPPPKKSASLPEYMWMLRHPKTEETLTPIGWEYKPVFDMDQVLGVNSHGVRLCSIAGRCRMAQNICPKTFGYLAHYKATCGEACRNYTSTGEEYPLLKYKRQVYRNVTRVLTKLKLI